MPPSKKDNHNQPSLFDMPPLEPSNLAMKHEREIVMLQSEIHGVRDEVAGVRTWLQKTESSMQAMALDLSSQLRALVDKTTQRNPMVYIGIGSLCIGLITAGSALLLFVMQAHIRPIESTVQAIREANQIRNVQDRENFEMVIRHDEKLKTLMALAERLSAK